MWSVCYIYEYFHKFILICNSFLISVQLIAILMVINALSVCISVMFTSLLLTRPLPQIPLWLKNDENGPALEDKSNNSQNEPENNITTIERQMACANIADYNKIQEIITKLSETFCEMQNISKRLGEIDKEDDLETQWKKIATRLNKILCLIFFVALSIMFLVAAIIWLKN